MESVIGFDNILLIIQTWKWDTAFNDKLNIQELTSQNQVSYCHIQDEQMHGISASFKEFDSTKYNHYVKHSRCHASCQKEIISLKSKD